LIQIYTFNTINHKAVRAISNIGRTIRNQYTIRFGFLTEICITEL